MAPNIKPDALTAREAAMASARAKTDALRAEAASIAIPFHIKASGRWLRLREINGEHLIYSAPAKQQRARAARHQPLLVETTISAILAA